MCRELGIAIVCYSPLGRGFFAGYKPEDATEYDFRKVWTTIALKLATSRGDKNTTFALNLGSG